MKTKHISPLSKWPQLAVSINDLTEAQNLMYVATLILSFLDFAVKTFFPPGETNNEAR